MRVDRLSLGGDGVARVEGTVVFVPYGSPGDTLEVEIVEMRRNFARARVLRVLEPSPVRTDPPCPYHFDPKLPQRLSCGGCVWQHMNYDFQLDAKRQLVEETLERLGSLRDVEVQPTLGMREPWRYRNKVQQPVGWVGDRPISGFYAIASHELVAIEDCLVQPDLSVRIVNRVRSLLNPRHKGWLRHLLIRTSQKGQAQLVFVTQSDDFPNQAQVIGTLLREFPALVGIHQNVNPAKTNVILGRIWKHCAGADALEEQLGSLRFKLSPGSFFQVNSPQAEVLYNVVKKVAGQGRELLDLYCGVGSIALWLAGSFSRVQGVDEVKSAIVDAQYNAKQNRIENTRFLASPTEQFLRSYRGSSQVDLTVILDPPRAGCDPRVLEALGRLRPRNLVYVSCDPGTLARDLQSLQRYGYTPRLIQPVDLFPHTAHIETVVHLPSRNTH